MRAVIDAALASHLIVASVYWWFSAKGFPISHARFWLNSVLPIAFAAACIALIILHRRRRDYSALAILCMAAGWATAAFTANFVFPTSLRGLWGVGLAAILVGGFASILLVRHSPLPRFISTIALTLSAAVAFFVVWAQQPPPPTTHPLDEPPPPQSQPAVRLSSANAPLAVGDATFEPSSARLRVMRGGVQITCEPLLEFDRISPDSFWSLLAPRGRTRATGSLAMHADDDKMKAYRYEDGSIIVVPTSAAPDEFELTSYVPVEQDAFTHLNAYCQLTIGGHKRLSLSFSPCPEKQIEVLPYDYPTGRAARFAYMDEAGEFRVVEGSSGEKGPFHTLAAGPLRRGEPLTINLHDDGQQIASITLEDWSAQASTDLSPTAGWRVPMNAIEFQRLGENPGHPVAIWITLAGTSVGRGWDTVGHREGVYRNRVRLKFMR